MKEVLAAFSAKTPRMREPENQKIADVRLREAYDQSALLKILAARVKNGLREAALFTDVDNTFHKVGYEKKMMTLFGEIIGQNIPVIAITGADFDYVLARIKAGILPRFTVIAGTVGTDIRILHELPSGEYEYKKDAFYENLLSETGFNRRKLALEAEKFMRISKKTHPEWRIDFQSPEFENNYLKANGQAPWKFKIGMDFFAFPEEIDSIRQNLAQGFPHANIVIHEELAHNQGRRTPQDGARKMYCINILPIGKNGTVHYLSQLLSIKEGVVAGDSGNDISMLVQNNGMSSVLVGGHTIEAGKHIHLALKGQKNKRRSFQRIVDPDGIERAIYIEPEGSGRQAIESIIRASVILRRIGNIKKMRTENKQKGGQKTLS